MNSIIFQESNSMSYSPRTKVNAMADVTLVFALDFTTAGEKLTKSMVKLNRKVYIPIDLWNLYFDSDRKERVVQKIFSFIQKDKKSITINIAGNGIYTLNTKGIDQEKIDYFVLFVLYEIIKRLLELGIEISEVRSGGQSGVDEAGAKAGVKLGYRTVVLCPKGFKFRGLNGIDIYSEEKFKDRFRERDKNTEIDKVVIN